MCLMKFRTWLAHEYSACNQHDQRPEVNYAATMFYAIAKFLHIIDNGPMFLSDKDAAACRHFGSLYLRASFAAAELCARHKILRWKFRPKSHYLDHQFLEISQTNQNPRFFQCWLDEDFMGKMSNLAGKTHAGNVSLRNSAIESNQMFHFNMHVKAESII